MIESQP